ncbi:hypothetical protein MBLNU230_g3927t1 [Neophaeotheca triangularis]
MAETLVISVRLIKLHRPVRLEWYVGAYVGSNLPARPTFEVPADANSGTRKVQIRDDVDWNNPESVGKAVHSRRMIEYRARVKYGLPMNRPIAHARQYSASNEAWIIGEHHRYAAANNNRRISMLNLTAACNAHFPREQRTNSSISKHVKRVSTLNTVRKSYRNWEGIFW